MKKKIPWQPMISTALSLLIAAAIIGLLMVISGSSELELQNPETITPIDFAPQGPFRSGMVRAAENDRYILWVDMSTAQVALYDKEQAQTFTSFPEGVDELDIKNNVKFRLKSLLSFEYSDRDSNAYNTQNSFAGSVNKGNYSVRLTEDGVRFDFYFENEGFLIPLEISLTEDGLRSSVPLADIREESDRVYLTTVTILPNFGAAEAADEGYLLLPDGCGALADFSMRNFTYTQRVYGEDYAVIKSTSERVEEVARLPVFGVKRNDSALLSVISSGAARSYIDAAAPTEKCPYATAAARFIYREIITVDISQKTFESTQVNVFENSPCALERFSVDYRVCDGKDYISMAENYRKYLTNLGVEPVSEPGDALYIDLVGGAMCRQSVLGIPVNRVLAITSFADAHRILDALKTQGVSGLTVNYRYWYQDGPQSSVTTDVKAEGSLGGDRGMEEFSQWCRDNEADLYLDLNLTDLQKERWGYSRRFASAQSVRREPVVQYSYLYSTFQKQTEGALCYLLSPSLLVDTAGKTARNLDRFSVAGYSANGLAGKIYSDMGERETDRGKAEGLWSEALGLLSEKTPLLLSAANAYAFPMADVITNVPVYSSGYRMETVSVPFYAAVMHGMAYLSIGDINGCSDPDNALLRALESGLGLKYTLGWENVARLSETSISKYSYISAQRWLSHAAENYKDLQGFLVAVSDQTLVRHELLTEDVRYSEFANGLGVYVNYSDHDYTAGSVTVPAVGYTPVGW